MEAWEDTECRWVGGRLVCIGNCVAGGGNDGCVVIAGGVSDVGDGAKAAGSVLEEVEADEAPGETGDIEAVIVDGV